MVQRCWKSTSPMPTCFRRESPKRRPFFMWKFSWMCWDDRCFFFLAHGPPGTGNVSPATAEPAPSVGEVSTIMALHDHCVAEHAAGRKQALLRKGQGAVFPVGGGGCLQSAKCGPWGNGSPDPFLQPSPCVQLWPRIIRCFFGGSLCFGLSP